jgi:uncharacterized protein YkwD
VHHSSAPAPLSERLARSLTRFLDLIVRFFRVLRPGVRHRGGRLALGALVSTVLTALVLSVPMVSGAEGGTPFVGLDSFAATSAARTTDGYSPVVMGRDGRPVSSSTFAGLSTSSAPAGRSSTDAFAGSAAPAPATTPAATADAAAAAPAPAGSAETSAAPAAPPVAEAAPAPAPAPAAAPAPAEPGVEGEVLALVNVQRAAAGCGALAADPALAAVARAHSADMRDRNFFSHVNPDGLDPFDRAARAGLEAHAENIAYGQPDPAAVMDAWMNSAGHRANILDCSLTRLGVGVAEGAGGPWWTQLFA